MGIKIDVMDAAIKWSEEEVSRSQKFLLLPAIDFRIFIGRLYNIRPCKKNFFLLYLIYKNLYYLLNIENIKLIKIIIKIWLAF